MNNEERMHKLANGTDTAIWAHDEIVSLREQVANTQKQLLSAKADGLREAIINCGAEIHTDGELYIPYESLLEELKELTNTTVDKE